MLTPNPDLLSRYPSKFCKTCGQGFCHYIECGVYWDGIEHRIDRSKNCDFSGETWLTDAQKKFIEENRLKGDRK